MIAGLLTFLDIITIYSLVDYEIVSLPRLPFLENRNNRNCREYILQELLT